MVVCPTVVGCACEVTVWEEREKSVRRHVMREPRDIKDTSEM